MTGRILRGAALAAAIPPDRSGQKQALPYHDVKNISTYKTANKVGASVWGGFGTPRSERSVPFHAAIPVGVVVIESPCDRWAKRSAGSKRFFDPLEIQSAKAVSRSGEFASVRGRSSRVRISRGVNIGPVVHGVAIESNPHTKHPTVLVRSDTTSAAPPLTGRAVRLYISGQQSHSGKPWFAWTAIRFDCTV